MNGEAIDADWTGTLLPVPWCSPMSTPLLREGTQEAIDAVKAELENGTVTSLTAPPSP